MSDKQDLWTTYDWATELRKEREGLSPEQFKNLFQCEPILGIDLAAPNGEWTVRWNKDKGFYERRLAGESHWERCA